MITVVGRSVVLENATTPPTVHKGLCLSQLYLPHRCRVELRCLPFYFLIRFDGLRAPSTQEHPRTSVTARNPLRTLSASVVAGGFVLGRDRGATLRLRSVPVPSTHSGSSQPCAECVV